MKCFLFSILMLTSYLLIKSSDEIAGITSYRNLIILITMIQPLMLRNLRYCSQNTLMDRDSVLNLGYSYNNYDMIES